MKMKHAEICGMQQKQYYREVHRNTGSPQAQEEVSSDQLNPAPKTSRKEQIKSKASAAAAAKSLQSCPTLCDPIDSSPPGPSVPRILQSRTLEWVAISFSNA